MSFCPKCSSERPESSGTDCPVCGSTLEDRRVLLPGTTINGFTIQHEIGRGGMGTVYLAKQANLGRFIALKVMEDSLTVEKDFIDGFFREVRAAARLNHPNIVQAIDAGIADNNIYYFAMELLDGQNLDQYLNEYGALPLELGLSVAEKIASGLNYATSKGLCHGDIKPENIILKKNGEIKLADLGLARDFRSDSLNPGEIRATPAYAPPEVIRREIEKIGFKSDMYSFGATLYHLLSGRRPFPGSSPEEICRKQLHDHAIRLHDLNPQIPLYISRLVDYLMEKDPQDRPDTWQTVIDILQQKVLSAEPEEVEEAEEREFSDADATPVHMRSFLLKYAVLILIFLIIILGLFVLLIHDGKDEEQISVTPPEAPADVDDRNINWEKPQAPVSPETDTDIPPVKPVSKPKAAEKPLVPLANSHQSQDNSPGKPSQKKVSEAASEWIQLKNQMKDKSDEECLALLKEYINKNGFQSDTEAKLAYRDLIEKQRKKIRESRLQQEKKAKEREEERKKNELETYRKKVESFYLNLAKIEEKIENKTGLESDDTAVVNGIVTEINSILAELRQLDNMGKRLEVSSAALPEEREQRILDYRAKLRGHLVDLKKNQKIEYPVIPVQTQETERNSRLEATDKAELKGMSKKQLKIRLQKLQPFARDLRKRGMFLWAERCDKQIKEIQTILQTD